jgi:hypothetical protein
MIISYIGKKDRLSLDNELELIHYIFFFSSYSGILTTF